MLFGEDAKKAPAQREHTDRPHRSFGGPRKRYLRLISHPESRVKARDKLRRGISHTKAL